jgi:Family of unknown function (DUF5906)
MMSDSDPPTNVTRLDPTKKRKKKNPPQPFPIDARIEDFYAYPEQNACIYTPNSSIWPAAYVDKRMPLVQGMKASKWLAQNRETQQITWAPGQPQIIKDKLAMNGGWKAHQGAQVYNLYTPPPAIEGDPAKAQLWVDHVSYVYPDTCGHIIDWLAHRVQHPGVKINHGLVLGGSTQVGKDTLLAPALRAVGHWNTEVVAPNMMLQRFNGFLKSVILVVSEARDLGEFDRYQFYEHMKIILAAPPDTLPVDEKNRRVYQIANLVGVVITTNHKDSLHLAPDDRRHHCSWSPLKQEDFPTAYFSEIWDWFEAGGYGHVAAYLADHDLSLFEPKRAPEKTAAFWSIVNATRQGEAIEMADLLDDIGRPDALCVDKLLVNAPDDFRVWLQDRKNRKLLGKRLNDCDYAAFDNPDSKDCLWIIRGKRQVIYVRQGLTVTEAFTAVQRLRQ